MAFRTNYRFERIERDRAKKAKKEEKLKKRQKSSELSPTLEIVEQPNEAVRPDE
jgi:reverse gyrase